MSKPLLELHEVSLLRSGRTLLDAVELSLDPGAIVAVAGPSGAGKTSLLRIALGLEAPTRGSVRLRGREVSRDGTVLLPPEQRGLAMVFQDLALWPHLSVHGNLAFALHALSPSERGRRVADMLRRVDLAGSESRRPAALSGGERQRVALARALVTEPDLLFLDEPLANLDVQLRKEMLELIVGILAERGTAALWVTHEPSEAHRLAQRVVVLESGRVVQTGTIAELAKAPQTAFVRAFAVP